MNYFIRGKQIKFYTAFIAHSYLSVSTDISLNRTQFLFIMKISNKIYKMFQLTLNHSLDINVEYFVIISKTSTAKLYFFLVNDNNFTSDNPLED